MSYYMSLMSLYKYDDSLFDDMSFPVGSDAEAIISTILASTAELEVIYPDFDTMQFMLGIFSRSRLDAWQKIFDTLHQYYNPLWNKEGTIEEVIHNLSNAESSNNAEAETEHKVMAYNDTTARDASKDLSRSGANASTTADGTQQTTRKEYGNIGVTTSQQMLKEEVEIRSSYDIAHLIAAEVKREYCLMIY